jgi:hypothetical protein
MPSQISTSILAEAATYANDAEELIRFLKNNGLSKAKSIIAFSSVTGVSPIQAKKTVHFSSVWSQERPGDELLHHLVERTLLADSGLPRSLS